MSQRLRPLVLRLAEPARRRVAGTKIVDRVNERVASSFRLLTPAHEELPDFDSLGLRMFEIESVCAVYGIDGLARRIPTRAEQAADLHQIAWHGSALADIDCAADHPRREHLLLDAALFNLAVALTDSLVDDDPSAGAGAARALAPEKLERRLLAPANRLAAITSDERGLDAFYG